MEGDDALAACFGRAGKGFGYGRVEAEFRPNAELKVTWHRTGSWAAFTVSDYLEGAPEAVLQDLADHVFARICADGPSEYPKGLLEWLTAPGFAESRRELYLRRDASLSADPAGRFKDLAECRGRLEAAGLVPEGLDAVTAWTRLSSGPAVRTSVLMRVAKVSGRLDREDVPDSVLDYCVYRGLCDIMAGFRPGSPERDADAEAMASRFPGGKEAEEWLESAGLELRGGCPPALTRRFTARR